MTGSPRHAVPADCDRIVVVGAGGFGREVLQWARHTWPDRAHAIAGFLSADPARLEGHAVDLPILAAPDDFRPGPGDGLLLAIGIRGVRRRVAERLEGRGCRFLTMIHPTAIVAESATIGTGAIVCPGAIISDRAEVGRFGLLNYLSSLAHDARTGDFAVLSPYAALAGGAVVGEDVFLGMHASVGPGCEVGAGSLLSANSSALNHVPTGSLVHGSPGRVSPHVVVADR